MVKATIVQDVVLADPDYCQPFEIYADASATQLGAVIAQNNRPLAFFSRKLSDTQKGYIVTKIELLAIVETLKEFKGIARGVRKTWGCKLLLNDIIYPYQGGVYKE